MDATLKKYLSRFDESAVTTLLDRFKAIIEYETSENRRWKELQDISGIPTHSWQKAYLGKQRPTSDMLEVIGQKWPEYAFWLITGITDVEHRHKCPTKSNPWPASCKENEEISAELTWKHLISIKPNLTKYLSDDDISPEEEARIDRALVDLTHAINVDNAYRNAVIKSVFNKTD